MTKQDIPDSTGTEKVLTDLTPKEFEAELSKFQEALKNDAFKDVSAYDVLGLEKPQAAPTPEDKQSLVNKETIERLLPAYKTAREELIGAGYDFKESESKMSEGEKDIHARLEKQAVAKFAEQKADILKIDPDFPTKIVEDLNISTDDKVAVMIGQKEIVSRNSDSVKKVQDELTKLTSELKEVKMSAPSEDKKEEATGKDIVAQMQAKFGTKTEVDKSVEDKKGETE